LHLSAAAGRRSAAAHNHSTQSRSPNRWQPVHPLPLFATNAIDRTLGDLFIRCMESSGTRQICEFCVFSSLSEGTRRRHRGLRPQLVHKASPIIRPKANPSKRKSSAWYPGRNIPPAGALRTGGDYKRNRQPQVRMRGFFATLRMTNEIGIAKNS
jgi:hypothetical protein